MNRYLVGGRITALAVAWWCACGDEIAVPRRGDIVSEPMAQASSPRGERVESSPHSWCERSRPRSSSLVRRPPGH
jgi:hypothetical protein